jgi:hypothetical protein
MITIAQRAFAPSSSKPRAIAPSIPNEMKLELGSLIDQAAPVQVENVAVVVVTLALTAEPLARASYAAKCLATDDSTIYPAHVPGLRIPATLPDLRMGFFVTLVAAAIAAIGYRYWERKRRR